MSSSVDEINCKRKMVLTFANINQPHEVCVQSVLLEFLNFAVCNMVMVMFDLSSNEKIRTKRLPFKKTLNYRNRLKLNDLDAKRRRS